jgi:polyisoprenoid-binding protein YceI
MKIPFRQEQSSKEQRILSAAFTVNRIDFGIGKKSWIMADEVQVKVKIYVPTI